jgi:uncharacterized protein YjgD (DUF1641 family)
MAKPIPLDMPPRNHQAELQQRLAGAPAEHAAALLDCIELIEVLHRNNVLSTLRGAVGARDSLVTHLARSASQPETVRALRNFIALTKLFAQIDPELIESVHRSIPPELLDRNRCRTAPPPSLWKIARTFWSPPVRRALLAAGFVLAGIGYYMNRERPERACSE